MYNFKDFSIKFKLIAIFVIFKVLPLIILSYIAISSFLDIDELLENNSKKIIKQSQNSVKNTTYLAIDESIKALDEKSKNSIEDKAVLLAKYVADFLYQRDADILFLSNLDINQKVLEDFYKHKKREVIVPSTYHYDEKKGWVKNEITPKSSIIKHTTLDDNKKEFHKVSKQVLHTKLIPIYKEVTFYKPDGKEIFKISSIDKRLKDISIKENTYLKAEDYFYKAKHLKKGQIYVSKVIGEYVPSVVIGKFTKEKAKKLHVKFEPTKYGYAGIENPVGKKFEGIIRFVTPVYKNSKLLGYLTLALNHRHIMDFTDYVNPTSPQKYDISDASSGNYAFMWSNDFECISHPRDYFIIGYDKNGKKIPGWIDAELEKKYEASKYKDLNQFLKTQPIFFNQSLKKKPNLKQLKIGQVGLDCKYLNFAPQCQGWSELVNDGGYGSFIIYWSKVWKLTVAASIPYYTGDYGNSKIGFGFITIGANVEDFHKAATDTKRKIKTILQDEFKKLEKNIKAISQELYKKIKQQIQHLSIITFILIVIVVYVAIILSNYITNKIKSIITGTQKLKERNFEYKIKYDSKDEFGELIKSFNEMASSINNLKKDLENKIYTDELTKLKNRVALLKKLEQTKDATIILIDIDGFKNINDFYGGEAGNFILKEFAILLQKFATKHSFTPYRIGSDDYALYTNEVLTPSEIKKVITALKDYIKSNKISSEYYNFDISFSFTCGVAFGKDNLIEKADLALNKAKMLRTLFVIYDVNDTSMNKHSEFIMWKEKITYAIKHDNIVPYFQPIVSVKNKDEKKYEVLMRLIDNGTPISPIFFLDIAKETRQYTELTKIILDKAFKKLLTTDAVFSINLSMIDITDKETVEYIYTNIKKYNIGNQIVFEILETENITDFDTILEFIKQVKALGVKIAIDDFGSGYSNFAYFSMMKPDFLKIDGSLIKNIKRGSTEYLIVEAIVKFAKSLNIMLVAEFVSNKEIYQTLLDFDIDYMQGYYFSEPKENL